MRQHDPIQVLVDEHEVISAAESQIRRLRDTWETNPDAYEEKVRRLLVFFRDYSDKFHHHKEEEVLFKALAQHPDFMLNDLISELEHHHEMFRETTAQIEGALQEKAWSRVQKLLEDYMNDLLDHIAVENEELFMIAESIFDENELAKIYFHFQDIDRDLGLGLKLQLKDALQTL